MRPTRIRVKNMKKIMLFAIVCVAAMGPVWAQDVITTREGKDIQAKIIEVTSDEIKYKKWNNQEGPMFTMRKSEVLIVRYQNGENEVFTDEPQKSSQGTYGGREMNNGHVHDRMLFAQYKHLYDPSFYRPEYGDPYSPGWCGFASFLIPGLGQGIAGEWGRGVAFFGAHVGMTSAGLLLAEETDGISALVALGLVLINDIWSIVDASKVAKIKNMYTQDVRKLQAGLGVSVAPSLAFVPSQVAGSQGVAAGLSLNLHF